MRQLLGRDSKLDVGSAPFCSFCGKGKTRRRKVVGRADGRYICDDCVDRVLDALSHDDIHKHLNG